MTRTQQLKTRGRDALGWIDAHWGPGRMVLSYLAMVAFAFIGTGAILGVMQAYTVDSAAAIVPTDLWIDVIEASNETSIPIEGALIAGIGALLLGSADFFGRIAFAYFLWVPEPVWNVVNYLMIASIFAIMGLNLLWAAQKVYHSLDLVEENPEGEVHA